MASFQVKWDSILERGHGWLMRWLWLVLCMACAPLATRAADDFLPPEQAFQVSVARVSADQARLEVQIAPGYYVYHESIKLQAQGARLGAWQLPAGKVKFDENFQKQVETHRDRLEVVLPITDIGSSAIQVTVQLQGCADAGLCYPPMTVVRALATSPIESSAAAAAGALSGPASQAADTPRNEAATDPGWWASWREGSLVEQVLESRNLAWVAAGFLCLGLLLSLTPCVLPMVPILSSLIVGVEGGASKRRSLLLACAYVLGMALVYTTLGVAAGYAGEGLGAALQTPWALAGFALLLVLFSLSMFEVYDLSLPGAITHLLTRQANRLPAGQVLGVFVMGGVSALIVSPCVTAPMAGALLFISRTGDVVLGAIALFFMALGMGVPLLVLGASAGHWLPRTGPWMYAVKRLFGLILLGVALWTVQPILPVALAMALWGLLLIAGGMMLRPWRARAAHHHPLRHALVRAGSMAALVWGALQLFGAATGGDDPLQPLAHWGRPTGSKGVDLPFRTVRTAAELDAAAAAAQGRVVLIDFYADWCVACKEMERFTFSDSEVARRMSHAQLVKVDVTANSDEARALMKRFRLFGPPATVFLDAQGRELPRPRVIGYESATQFVRTLRAAGL